jgi:predicted DNA-binding transcriptional regulator AlpA
MGPHHGQTRPAADIPDRVLSRRQYAGILGVTLRTLSRYEKAGNAPPRTRLSDRRWGYRRSAVDRFLSANTEQGNRISRDSGGALPLPAQPVEDGRERPDAGERVGVRGNLIERTRGESPSPAELRSATSPRKRGEVKAAASHTEGA